MSEVHPEVLLNQVKGLFAPRPMVLDPFRNGRMYGKHAILDLTDNVAYASIEITVDLPIERLGRVSFERGNTEIIAIDARMFHVRDKYLKLPVVAKGVDGASKTRLVISFADETLRTKIGIRRGELVHLDGEMLQMKIGVAAKEADDPEIPEFVATARVLDAQPVRVFQQRWTETSINQTQVGEQKHDFPLIGMNVRLRRMYLETENNDISKVEIRRDNKTIYEIDVEDLEFNQRRFGNRAPQDGFVVLDWTDTGFAAEQAYQPVMDNSLKMVITKRSTGTVIIHMDWLDKENDLS